jgi:hypothetical protein
VDHDENVLLGVVLSNILVGVLLGLGGHCVGCGGCCGSRDKSQRQTAVEELKRKREGIRQDMCTPVESTTEEYRWMSEMWRD